MAAVSWKNPSNGDWGVATNWSADATPSLTDDATISAAGSYIVTISGIDVANSLTFNASQAALLESAAELIMVGALTVNSGFVSLNTTNIMGSVALSGGAIAFSNGGALGVGAMSMTGGELLATANLTLSNQLAFSGTSTIAAAHGTTLNENAAGYTISGNTTLNIGSLGQDGTILWHTNAGSQISSPATVSVDVQAGTLEAADSQLSLLLGGAKQTTVAVGATVDVAGVDTSISDLLDGGVVTDSGAPATLTLAGANFSGVISGPLSLVANGAVILSGANTYTGTTTVHAGHSLQLGIGGATGSIEGGDISDAGVLIIDLNNAVTLTNAISGAGGLQQIGTGVTSINTANTYTGGTTLSAGTLAIGDGGALGTGALTVANGELLATESATFANKVNLSTPGSAVTFAAAPDMTLTLTGALTLTGNSTIDIGAPGQDGNILWESTTGGTSTGNTMDVLGALTAGSSDLGTALSAFSGTTVEADGTLDWAGNVAAVQNLQGAGTVTNSGAAQTMTLNGATNFSGTISGALSLVFNGNAALSGLEDTTGSTTLNGPITLANTGDYDIAANENITGTPASSFVNNGLFEKTGGSGGSVISSNFVNNGTLSVLGGSVQFTGGFTNNGVVHGLITQNDGVTTISEQAPSDFNADGFSDILWQNVNGEVASWEMNGTNPIAGGSQLLSADPGPTWNAIRTGDFNGDGFADILWQNSNGQAAIWEMNGSSQIPNGSAVVGSNPGPDWKVVGAGDFNNDGHSDILWQNVTTGQAAIWEMNGTTVIGAQTLDANPGPTWTAVGTGDFNGDGFSDILLQNASGQVAIWEMNGFTQIAGGSQHVDADPGPDWKVVGTGDFDGDGHSDILWQNVTTGQAAIWEMNGANVIGTETINANPGPTWTVAGTGDFNGDGFSDILWQNASGQAAVWEMDGFNQIAGGSQQVDANPGPSWRAIG